MIAEIITSRLQDLRPMEAELTIGEMAKAVESTG
jgi:hypothetical protein